MLIERLQTALKDGIIDAVDAVKNHQLAPLRESEKTCSTNVQKLEDTIKSKTAELETLEKERQQLPENTKTQLKEDIKKADEKIASTTNDLRGLNVTIQEQIDAKTQTINDLIASKSQEKDHLALEIKNQAAKLFLNSDALMENENAGLLAENNSIELETRNSANFDSDNQELLSLEEKNAALQAEIDQLKLDLQELPNQIRNANTTNIAPLNNAINEATENRKKLDAEYFYLTINSPRPNAPFSSTFQTFEQEQTRLNQAIVDSQAALVDLRTKAEDANQELETARLELNAKVGTPGVVVTTIQQQLNELKQADLTETKLNEIFQRVQKSLMDAKITEAAILNQFAMLFAVRKACNTPELGAAQVIAASVKSTDQLLYLQGYDQDGNVIIPSAEDLKALSAKLHGYPNVSVQQDGSILITPNGTPVDIAKATAFAFTELKWTSIRIQAPDAKSCIAAATAAFRQGMHPIYITSSFPGEVQILESIFKYMETLKPESKDITEQNPLAQLYGKCTPAEQQMLLKICDVEQVAKIVSKKPSALNLLPALLKDKSTAVQNHYLDALEKHGGSKKNYVTLLINLRPSEEKLIAKTISDLTPAEKTEVMTSLSSMLGNQSASLQKRYLDAFQNDKENYATLLNVCLSELSKVFTDRIPLKEYRAERHLATLLPEPAQLEDAGKAAAMNGITNPKLTAMLENKFIAPEPPLIQMPG